MIKADPQLHLRSVTLPEVTFDGGIKSYVWSYVLAWPMHPVPGRKTYILPSESNKLEILNILNKECY